MTIKLDEQREGGELSKKSTHQVFTSDLTWNTLISQKGAGSMEELIRGLLHDRNELHTIKTHMAVGQQQEPSPPHQGRGNRVLAGPSHVNTLGMGDDKKKGGKKHV